MTEVVSYRTYESGDIPQILNLWKNHSDFGAIDEDVFNLWFLQTPYETCEIVVAENETNGIIGQMIFMPSRLLVKGKEIKTFRIAAPIIHNDFKLTISDLYSNPLWGMFMYGIQIAVKKNFSLAYFFPARGWLKAIEMVKTENDRWELASFRTFSIPFSRLQNKDNRIASNYHFKLCHSFTEEYDELWEDAIEMLPVQCGIVRKKDWLTYRLGGHLTIECRSKINERLIGYLSVKKSNGLLIDILARTQEDMESVLQGAVQMISESKMVMDYPHQYITGMYTPQMEKTLLGFSIDFSNYEFAFGCYVIDRKIAHEEIRSSEWYLMPDV